MTQFSSETKEKIAELCRKNKVRELSLFGSRVRGDHRPDSDYDFLIEFLPNSEVSLFEYVGMKLELEELLGNEVDLVSKSGLKRRIRSGVLSEAREIYAG